ncbi:MAG: hypothetical protein OXF43_04485 [Gammaproteobacteria bacterium]|nr:hypothetical protein [Gammaproteobacteria bacterium]
MNFWRFFLAGALLSLAAGFAHANAPLTQQDPQAGGAGSASAETESLADLDLRIEELQNQMAVAMAEVERVNRERAELLARLDDLDSQIALARQAVDSQRQQLAQLQANLAAGAEQGGRPEADQAAAAGAEAGSGAEAPSSGLNPVLIGIGLALAALALLVLRMMRQGREEAEEPLPAAVGTADIGDNAEPVAVAAEPASGPDTDSTFEAEVGEPTTSAAEDETDEFEGETFRIEPDRLEPTIEPTIEARIEPGPATIDPAAMIGETSQDQEQGPAAELEIRADDDSSPAPEEDEPGGNDENDEYVIDLDNGDAEEIAERLNLAYSFHRMGDTDQARRILEQVIRVGNEAQIGEARQLLAIIHDLD